MGALAENYFDKYLVTPLDGKQISLDNVIIVWYGEKLGLQPAESQYTCLHYMNELSDGYGCIVVEASDYSAITSLFSEIQELEQGITSTRYGNCLIEVINWSQINKSNFGSYVISPAYEKVLRLVPDHAK